MILIFDTETSGLAPRNARLEDQPRLIQLGAAMYTYDGQEISAIDILIDPTEWTQHQKHSLEAASQIHGISYNGAKAYGIPLKTALSLFIHFVHSCGELVGHNREYDDGVIAGEFSRIGHLDSYEKAISTKNRFCTMEMASPVCAIPPTPAMLRAGRSHFKNPNLTEAHKFLFGEGFSGAHSALTDVRACARVFFELRKRNG